MITRDMVEIFLALYHEQVWAAAVNNENNILPAIDYDDAGRELAKEFLAGFDEAPLMTNRQRVIQFNQEVLGIGERPVGLMNPGEMMLSLQQLREEIQEIEDAYNAGDLVGVVDGYIDLDFFARGGIYKMGITPDTYSRCFAAVFDCNMQKARGKKAGRGDGTAADAIKPEGWEPPEEKIRVILEEQMDK